MEAELVYIRTVLAILAEAELTWQDTPVLWHVYPGTVRFSMVCSDTFAWGTADAEPIEPGEDVELLADCLAELKAAEKYGEIWLPLLYCCRKRGMRPMNRYMQREIEKEGMPDAVKALIEACGPPRRSVFGAP